MKLSNIFKKAKKEAAISNIEVVAKNQMSKVIGGSGPVPADKTPTTPTTGDTNESIKAGHYAVSN